MKRKLKKGELLAAERNKEKRARLDALSERLFGVFPNFMTQEDLKTMREDAKWEAMK